MMMKKIFKSALYGALLGACLSATAFAQTLTPTDKNGQSTTSIAAGTNGWSLSFPVGGGTQPLGQKSTAQTIKLTATGGVVKIYAVAADSSDFIISANSCTPNMDLDSRSTATDNCTFDVQFAPVSGGARYAEVIIKSNASNTGAAGAPTAAPIVYLYGNAALTQPQIVSFSSVPGNTPYTLNGTTNVSATSSVGLPVTISASGACSGSGTGTATVNITDGGTCNLSASAAATSVYSSANASASFTVTPASQTINYSVPGSQSYVRSGTFQITVSAPGGAVTTASTTPDICSISGTTVTMNAPGTCALMLTQGGSSKYSAAPTANPTILLTTLQPQTITFGTAPSLVVGGTASVTANGGASGQPVTFAASGACTISGAILTGVSFGTCTVTASQNGTSTYAAATPVQQTIQVGKGSQTITFGPAPAIVAGGSGNVSATGGPSGNQVTFTAAGTCTISGTLVSNTTVGTCTITANQAGDANYNAAAPATQVINIADLSSDLCAQQGLNNREILASSLPGGFLTPFSIGPNQSISFVLDSPSFPMSGSLYTTYSDSEKVMSISANKCDWSASLSDPFKGMRCLSWATEPGLSWANVQSFTSCVLQQGKTYYVNIRNAKLTDGATLIRPIQDSCTTGACNFSIRF